MAKSKNGKADPTVPNFELWESVAKPVDASAAKSVPTDASTPAYANEPEYRAAVERCKAASAEISRQQWVHGDEADAVTQKWGEKSLEQFADDINYHGAPCTLGRCRDVCRAWPQNRARARFFSSAKILATHPHRWEIVERSPDISKAEARAIMRQWNADNQNTSTPHEAEEDDDGQLGEDEKPGPTPEAESEPAKAAKANGGAKKTAKADEWSFHSKRWQAEAVETADKAIELAEARTRCNAEQRRDLLAVLEPKLIETICKASEELGALVRWLRTLSTQASNDAIKQGRVKTSPSKRAPELRAEA